MLSSFIYLFMFFVLAWILFDESNNKTMQWKMASSLFRACSVCVQLMTRISSLWFLQRASFVKSKIKAGLTLRRCVCCTDSCKKALRFPASASPRAPNRTRRVWGLCRMVAEKRLVCYQSAGLCNTTTLHCASLLQFMQQLHPLQ